MSTSTESLSEIQPGLVASLVDNDGVVVGRVGGAIERMPALVTGNMLDRSAGEEAPLGMGLVAVLVQDKDLVVVGVVAASSGHNAVSGGPVTQGTAGKVTEMEARLVAPDVSTDPGARLRLGVSAERVDALVAVVADGSTWDG